MKLLIFKTNIEGENKVKSLFSLFTFCPEIYEWTVDLEDRDKVLRIEASESFKQESLVELLRVVNLRCEALPD